MNLLYLSVHQGFLSHHFFEWYVKKCSKYSAFRKYSQSFSNIIFIKNKKIIKNENVFVKTQLMVNNFFCRFIQASVIMGVSHSNRHDRSCPLDGEGKFIFYCCCYWVYISTLNSRHITVFVLHTNFVADKKQKNKTNISTKSLCIHCLFTVIIKNTNIQN